MQNQKAREQFKGTQRLTFIVGCCFSLIAFLVPMDILGMSSLFTVHMIQHLLLSLIVPPLFLLSIPPSSLHQFLSRHKQSERAIRIFTIPLVASALFNGNLWIWHAPLMLSAMMSNDLLHVSGNLLYLVTGLLFWWPLLNPTQETKHALSLGGKLAYLFFSDMPMMLLGAGMTFSAPLYSLSMTNPRMLMIITAQDQQVGGLLMWVVGSIFFIVVASVFFLRWMLQQEKVQQAEEREQEGEDTEEMQEGSAPDGLIIREEHLWSNI